MRTIARESPAIVEGPNNADVLFLEISEKHGQIAIMVVYIMQMNDIGRKPIKLVYESLSIAF